MGTDIKILEFEQFRDVKGIIHGVFTRSGGVSQKPFDSLNVGMNSGDDTANVARNRKMITLKMGMKPLVFLNQVHGTDIKVLKKDDSDFSIQFEPGREIYTADAVITDMKGVFLVIQVADCQAVMLYDPKSQVIANIHSGWRGSVKNILGKCLARMTKEFGCNPENILAGISPSLGPCCAEFINYEKEIPNELWKYKHRDKDCFDFWQISADQLVTAGVGKENIENMGMCTKCSTKQFYSYRAQKITGRFASMISMV